MRRYRPIHANVRSTTHRRGRWRKPLGRVITATISSVISIPGQTHIPRGLGAWRTTSTSHCICSSIHSRPFPVYAESTHTFAHARKHASDGRKPQLDSFPILQIGHMNDDG